MRACHLYTTPSPRDYTRQGESPDRAVSTRLDVVGGGGGGGGWAALALAVAAGLGGGWPGQAWSVGAPRVVLLGVAAGACVLAVVVGAGRSGYGWGRFLAWWPVVALLGLAAGVWLA